MSILYDMRSGTIVKSKLYTNGLLLKDTLVPNIDLNPEWVFINSPFNTDMTDLTGKVWVVHGNANVNNNALQLNGNGDYLDMPHSPDFHFGTSEDSTIRFKVFISSLNARSKILLSTRYDGEGVFNWALSCNGGAINLLIWGGVSSGVDTIVSKNWQNAYLPDTLFELSLERKDMAWRLYIDGVQAGVEAVQPQNYVVNSNSRLTVGSYFNAGGGTVSDLIGAISNVQILKGIALGGGDATTPLIT